MRKLMKGIINLHGFLQDIALMCIIGSVYALVIGIAMIVIKVLQ